MKKMNLAVAAILATLMTTSPLYAEATGQEPPEIQMLSGGVGEGELERITALENEYTLKLIFAQPDGEYLANVAVLIRDHKNNILVNKTSQGPVVLIKLTPGTYTLTSKAGADTKTRSLVVRKTGLTTYYIHLQSA